MKSFVVLLFLFSGPALVVSYCDLREAQQCVAKYSKSLASLNDAEQAEEACRNRASLLACMKRYTDGGCDHANLQSLFQGIRDALNYICVDGYEIFLRHRQCFKKKSVVDNIKSCEDEINDRKDRLLSEATYKDADTIKKEGCSMIDAAKKCMYNAVESECGKEAADYQLTVIEKTIKPIMSKIDCHGLSSSTIRIIIIAACITGGVILSSLAMAFRHYRRTRPNPHTILTNEENQFQNPRNVGVEAPPPYSFKYENAN